MVTEAERAICRAPWAKADQATGDFHHLAHHCADVAACFESIVSLPVARARLEKAARETLSREYLARLTVLCFLHDVGKLHPGFQAKGWPQDAWPGPRHGHVNEAAAIFCGDSLKMVAQHLCVVDLMRWGVDQNLLFSVLAHHGRPFSPNSDGGKHWDAVRMSAGIYEPVAASAEVGAMIHRWFPLAFSSNARKLPSRSEFQHLFCGFVALADWLGSDRRFFPFVGQLDPNYIDKARERARLAVSSIGLDTARLKSNVAGHMDFCTITGFSAPNVQQLLIGTFPLDEQLVILEAETGSGKTEAAFWRFALLFEAGRVDSLYFALPTRTSAVQLHGRVNKMLKHLLGDQAPEAVLAVPGYFKAGDVEGEALPGWKVRWDDDGNVTDEVLEARWAAESAKRYLAAVVAVGTIDQAMLAALQVKHAHLRAAALSRSLLVIDEVHASDSYMAEVQSHLLRMHVGYGGYAMLMSATLGSRARIKWLDSAAPSFEKAVTAPYPALWSQRRREPVTVSRQEKQKTVAMTLLPTMAPEEGARLAIEASKHGARVLVIRNTVKVAIATWSAVREAGGEALLLSVSNGPALHHGRFAPEDRRLLDAAVEKTLSPKDRGAASVIVIGTQTLEQSLDIDADLLITDLCPVDVLLQRIGRLHRHSSRPRPGGFEAPACYVMQPEKGLSQLLGPPPAFENGLGAWRESGVLNGIYRDLSMLELTRRLILEHPAWSLPAMNRMLVESATHEERIDELHQEMGQEWIEYRNNVIGKEIADMGAAKIVALPVKTPFADVLFPQDEERIRTRLGEEGARITFAEPVVGPFGGNISCLTLPAHWSRGLDTREPVNPRLSNGLLTVTVGDRMFTYDRSGLMKGKK